MADAKERAQLQLILDGLPDAAVYPADWADEGNTSQYLYRRNRVLARTADVDEVATAVTRLTAPANAALRGGRVDVARVSGGISAIDIVGPAGLVGDARAVGGTAPEVPDLLDTLDRELGPGRAQPETVVYGVGYGCPASEPEEVPHDTRHPWPRAATRELRHRGKRLDRCDCCGEKRCGCAVPAPTGDGAGVRVALFDTGLSAGAAQSHYWLNGVTGEDDPHRSPIGYGEGHGTFSAGVLRSVAPAASVHVYRVLDTVDAAFESDVVRRMQEVLTAPGPKPHVVLVCFVTAGRGSAQPFTFEELYTTTISALPDLAVVAPAGNDGTSTPMYPAAFDWAVSVGALDGTWQHRADFSNFGPTVDVYAPGEDLVNAFVHGCYDRHESVGPAHRHFSGMARWSGTSFSAPMVAGLIAAEVSTGPLTARQAADRLIARARQTAQVPSLPVVLP